MQSLFVYQCNTCQTVLSDSLHQASARPASRQIDSSQPTAIAVVQAQVEQAENAVPQVDPVTYSVTASIRCVKCKASVGHRLLSTSKDLDHLRGCVVLDSDAITRYQLGQAGTMQAELDAQGQGTEVTAAPPSSALKEPDTHETGCSQGPFVVFKQGPSWQAADHEIAMLKSYACVLHEAISDLREQLLVLQDDKLDAKQARSETNAVTVTDAQMQTEAPEKNALDKTRLEVVKNGGTGKASTPVARTRKRTASAMSKA
ncbi:hypothetical protein BCR37DRAFT_390650 [Protomyces lactucae-debilis]|uniref:Mis18 domain-containing protein n=1 Tax=Protomyces lactucae-debilis TaxID=2754530 RepID=A0A1Y2FUQ8_PROLT|nr:uncharacterized protein BCR37DRAFT_390650 [Protomyces lactucae-debilis]ORY86926.1 hypothetical protein BCR37DRAFT_390650 [Protomyces lactucae-debilis]